MTAAISVMKDLLPLLEQVVRAGKPLLVIAEEEPPACRARTAWRNQRQLYLPGD